LPFSDLLGNGGAIIDPGNDINFVESDVGFKPENRENDDIDDKDEDEFVGSLTKLAETVTNLTEDGGVNTIQSVHIHFVH
jgi:hypothetical protein